MPEKAIDKLLKRRKVGGILIERGLITPEQLEHALALQRQSDPRQLLGEIILEQGMCTADQLTEALASAYDIPYAKLEPALVDAQITRVLPVSFIKSHNVLPLFYVDRVLTVAVSDPTNLYLIEEVNQEAEGTVQVVAASTEDVQLMIETLVPHDEEYSIEDLVEDSVSEIDVIERQTQDKVNLEEVASESPVIKLVNYMIYTAVRERASDIHIEPDDDSLRVRFRIDGQMVERLKPPYQMHPAIVSRIKIMASLDISERRLPQDGSIHVMMEGHPADLRISILPTTFGEKVVIRIIDKSTVFVSLEQLGLDATKMEVFQREISKPHGLVLVTGPTGSGKSTTLYSVLKQLEQPEINICTAEDPIEFNLANVNQFQVNHKIGLTFAAITRALLRQDPDIIMVGEMRDQETGAIGVQAALTGHMVFSTLHTNDAPGAITRLFNLGIEPYLVGASLTAILAQRLVRQICPHCRVETDLSERVRDTLARRGITDTIQLHKGRGCTRCRNVGFLGRVGIFELLVPDDDMRDLITAGAPLEALRTKALELGMKPLFEDGLDKVCNAATTIEEVLRVTVEA
ncbi:MAG: ATPase, T2SS/T4P/T4SS family [Planctomycetota bacterium]|nr:ATPase, T2SS/T4P/T4SS family [Planctomycetota bacterium]